MRRPVLASALGAHAETVVDGETGWLGPPGDISAWSRALDAILALSTRGPRAGRPSRPRAGCPVVFPAGHGRGDAHRLSQGVGVARVTAIGKVLVIKLSAVGDFVLALPAFERIRAAHRDATITLLTTPPFETLAQTSPFFDRVEIDGRPRGFAAWLAMILRLRRERYARVYDLQNNDRTNLIFQMMRPSPPEWSGTRVRSRLAAPQPGAHDPACARAPGRAAARRGYLARRADRAAVGAATGFVVDLAQGPWRSRASRTSRPGRSPCWFRGVRRIGRKSAGRPTITPASPSAWRQDGFDVLVIGGLQEGRPGPDHPSAGAAGSGPHWPHRFRPDRRPGRAGRHCSRQRHGTRAPDRRRRRADHRPVFVGL